MKFERGQDIKKSMNIGASKEAIKVMDIVLIKYDEDSIGPTKQVLAQSELSKKEVKKMLQSLSDRKTPVDINEFKKLRRYYKLRNESKDIVSWNKILSCSILKYDDKFYKITGLLKI
jgi:hypothetical protein